MGMLKKEDGFWLSFQSQRGKCALVNVGQILTEKGQIINAAILDTCEECASNKEERGESAPCRMYSKDSTCEITSTDFVCGDKPCKVLVENRKPF